MGAGKRFSAMLEPGGEPGAVVAAALAATDEFARDAGLAPPDQARLAVVVEELVSNASRHGAASGRLGLELTLTLQSDGVRLTLEDDGAAFDPTCDRGFSGPDSRTGGGVGLALVRAWADGFTYARVEGRNRLELRLRPA